ncbi:membrin-11-like [Olea europaea subsp. europaea]|uniref:Membrin n=1 Tax=Olea europaea subsp. europaea TaxID=158383 RepID=A0A8S0Q8N8_OLEEU|nr:membrin-11-like [Olea europaea subsp. europaea]
MATVAESGGGSLSELYSSSKRLLLKTRESLERIERLEYTSSSSFSSSSTVVPGTSDDQAAVIRRDINQIQSLCVDMDRLWRSIAAKSQRDLWKRKVEQVVEEAESFRTSLDKYISRHQKRMQEVQERAELLGRANGQSSHILRIFDEEAQAVQSVRNSSRMLEEAYATGVAVLSKYSEQRDHLKVLDLKCMQNTNRCRSLNCVCYNNACQIQIHINVHIKL